MTNFARLLERFAKDERGVFAVIFGLTAIVLIAMGGAVVDYVTLQQTRDRAQIALDAAVLALQPEINKSGVTQSDILKKAQDMVLERIGPNVLEATVDRIDLNRDEGRLFLGGQFKMSTIFVRLVGVDELGAAFTSEAVRGSVDLEVSIALDVTGSMAGSRIEALKVAVADLVQAIVQDDQDLTYSKVALAPYSQAVNAGRYAEALRGPIRPIRDITNIAWSTGAKKTITAASKAYSVELTSKGHGFANGDWVYVKDVSGMTQINKRAFVVSRRTNDTFELQGVDGRQYSNYKSGGSVVKCLVANCSAVVTSQNHGFVSGDQLYFRSISGIADFNNKLLPISNATADNFVLEDVSFNRDSTYRANTGEFFCTWQDLDEGCPYYAYFNTYGSWVMSAITDCVTERALNPFNDQPPSTTYVGRNYPRAGTCPNAEIVPLTTDKLLLLDRINSLPASGNTSGSLGILWSWYMLSPNFGYVWPEESRPAAYRGPHLLKAAVIMTDGEFNTVHCEGVPSRDSSGGSERNSCNAPNGKPYPQSERYCDEMKATGIRVYTVGFGIRAGTAAANIMAYCASTPGDAYLAQDAASLKDAFAQIARNISALRLTQ
ncbi:MAG: hypothetical protein ABS75_29635 [Pelagibacterium sp. SCN 63-23]|nr:MAG: hypothetical protein ABS75_29635 [Pelagibacterium sp. SCN 63-23]